LGFYSTSFSLKNIMIHEIKKSWIEKTLLKLIESLQKKQKDQIWEEKFQSR